MDISCDCPFGSFHLSSCHQKLMQLTFQMTPTSDEEESSSDEEQTQTQSPPLTQNRRKVIWDEEAEISLLLQIMEYEGKGKTVASDINDFTEVVNAALDYDLSSKQLRAEISRMKKRFKRQYQSDQNKTFPSKSKRKIFNMSKVIWGEEVVIEHAEKSNQEAGKKKGKSERKSSGKKKAEDLEFMGSEKRLRLKDDWKQLKSSGKKKVEDVECVGMEKATLIAEWNSVDEQENELKKRKLKLAEAG